MVRIVVSALLSLALPAAGQEAEISFKSTELAPGLYMLEGEGGCGEVPTARLTGEHGTETPSTRS